MKRKLMGVVIAALLLCGVKVWAQEPPPEVAGGSEIASEPEFDGVPGPVAALRGSDQPCRVWGAGPGSAWAQESPSPDEGGPMRGGAGMRRVAVARAMEEFFFPPELVRRNQVAIGLKPEQQEALRTEMQKTMARFTDLQWQQSAQLEALEALYQRPAADEKEVLAQFDKLLALETEIKRLRLASLIRVKNMLSPQQQAQLRDLARQDRQERPRPLLNEMRERMRNGGPAARQN
jgi:hypothetical protein